MPKIVLRHISKNILKDVNLEIMDKELLVLVGPNGAGKSTLLNIMAGLTDYRGEIFFDDKKMDDIPPHKRGVGYLFQDLALFPHLNVYSNIAYGLNVQGYPEKVIKKRVEALLDALHIGGLRERHTCNLSGGEKQRVAIARALAPFQKILLLDEPMSGLDPQTSKYLRTELCALLKRLEITSVFVVHDLLGAEEMADRIAIIHKGQIEQLSAPNDIFFSPRTDIVSEFIGMPNILNCDYCNILSIGLVEVVSGDMSIILPYEGSSIKKLAIPPHDIYISDTKPPGPALNRYKGIITEILPVNSTVRVRVAIGSNNMLTELQKSTFDEMNLGVGKEVYVIVKLRRLRYVEP
ncbi:MAG TPA: ABC transporter ATP-binding protein [Syntrophorhabdaceae bacterium]|nr:ABC transporter ATP-binding protein [Syntrophorhabdaceae bacterium]HNZ59014.1 ABC transporter ATP-binding protein [Syntrophorhabdaceae bacterium]HOG40139.1 ABC transporter ATP-binding protein [Syntrophorhabdaceae bacterium]HOS58515.1 ABC transporter ATP-binding protein [Syntrophorhabdaceae bacterium]HQG51160.1 ABC transporter ATP-binding protein [Syntrophorhabdaceae bacterium]